MKTNMCRILFCIVVFCFNQAKAQNAINTNSPQTSIPPAPEAASLGKYVDVPVDYYNGLPQISIPLYTLSERDISLPIGLSYHAGGHKVTDIASWVGLGWSLNAGGVITREIRNIPDDYSGPMATEYLSAITVFTTDSINKIVSYLDAYKNNGLYNQAVEEAIYVGDLLSGGCIDLEPDIFYINVSGITAKFAFDKNGEIVVSSDQRILVEPTQNVNGEITSWTVVAPDGMEYLFSERENTVSVRVGQQTNSPTCDALWNNLTYTSSWFLKKITSRTTGHYLNFEYEDYSIDHGYTENESISHNISNSSCPQLGGFSQPIRTINNNLNTAGKRLSRIETKAGAEVIFLPSTSARTDVVNTNAYSLHRIRINNWNEEQIKEFEFEYDYSIGESNDRLTLKKMWQVGSDNSKMPPYIFDYNSGKLPARTSKAQDYWGFYNGKTSNSHLIPSLFVKPFNSNFLEYFKGADRSPSISHTKSGVLEQITYPTGGTRTFEYELNDFSYISNDLVSDQDFYECTTQNLQVYAAGQSSPQIQSETFVITEETVFSYQLSFSPPPLLGDFQGTTPYFELSKINVQSSTSIFRQEWEDNFFNGVLLLAPGTYKAESFAYAASGGSYDYVDAHLSWQECDLGNPIQIQKAGGLRIKEIIASDGISNEYITTTFEYRDDNQLSTGVFASSADLPQSGYFRRVGFQYYPFENMSTLYSQEAGNPTATIYENCMMIYRSASPSFMLGAGSHIEYAEVRMTRGAGVGSQVYQFSSSKDAGYEDVVSFDTPTLPPISNGHKRGRPILSATYDEQSRQVKSEEFNYYYGDKNISAFKLQLNCDCITKHPNNFTYNFGGIRLGYHQTSQTATTEYFSLDGVPDALTVTNTFAYNQEGLPINQQTVKSNGEQRTIRYKYPTDYDTSIDGALEDLVIDNRISSPIEVTQWDGAELSRSMVTTYSNPNGTSLVEATYQRDTEDSSYSEPTNSSGDYTSMIDNPANYITELTILNYDDNRQVTDYIGIDGVNQSFIWGYNGILPVASVSNAGSDEVYYESFEEHSSGIFLSDAKSGIKVFFSSNAYNFTPTDLSYGTYQLSYWAKMNNGDWERYSSEIIYSGGVISISSPIQGASYYLDEIRIHPIEAQMTTYAYTPLRGVITKVDVNGNALYYSYDVFGRLEAIKDHDGNILQEYQYKYGSSN